MLVNLDLNRGHRTSNARKSPAPAQSWECCGRQPAWRADFDLATNRALEDRDDAALWAMLHRVDGVVFG